MESLFTLKQKTSECPHASVGAVLFESGGLNPAARDRLLTFDHTDGKGVSGGVAGHVEKGQTVLQALTAEVEEEVGLTATNSKPLINDWRDEWCGRQPANCWDYGHRWEVLAASWTGTLNPSERETANVAWRTPGELQQLADRTYRAAWGEVSPDDWRQQPGLEPVWVRWLVTAGAVRMSEARLAAVDLLGMTTVPEGGPAREYGDLALSALRTNRLPVGSLHLSPPTLAELRQLHGERRGGNGRWKPTRRHRHVFA